MDSLVKSFVAGVGPCARISLWNGVWAPPPLPEWNVTCSFLAMLQIHLSVGLGLLGQVLTSIKMGVFIFIEVVLSGNINSIILAVGVTIY